MNFHFQKATHKEQYNFSTAENIKVQNQAIISQFLNIPTPKTSQVMIAVAHTWFTT